MPKKKISSQDFLNLMDEQEDAPEKMAFNPKKAAAPKKPKAKKKQEDPLLGRFKLTPLQEEWLRFAKSRTPQFVIDFVQSPVTQMLVSQVEARLGKILR